MPSDLIKYLFPQKKNMRQRLNIVIGR